ncbi:hypothetical protein [Crossiella cryophila]|uniref:Uncharacterized protein n=1 Tax=Crossiella cryophila TaxID=43355 RepID=A0A7W7FS05_9PSEU|nr:hypothetical protein [Crossiella cryophila]MBB4674918.1 hypothetical protein [Crossiella cryophila]
MVLQEIHAGFKQTNDNLKLISDRMNERFDRIDNALNTSYREMMRGFGTVVDLLRQQSDKLETIHDQLLVLASKSQQFNQQFNQRLSEIAGEPIAPTEKPVANADLWAEAARAYTLTALQNPGYAKKEIGPGQLSANARAIAEQGRGILATAQEFSRPRPGAGPATNNLFAPNWQDVDVDRMSWTAGDGTRYLHNVPE